MLAAGDEHNSIEDAIIYAYNQGLTKDEILEVINSSLPDDLHNKAISIIENINYNCNSKLLYLNDLPQLFNHIFNLVYQGFSDDDILNQLSSSCDLEQFEFTKYALRYISINRIPSVWELNNVYNELIGLDIDELIKRCEVIKNLRNKQVAYQIMLQHFYKAFCDGQSIKWFMDIANQTTDGIVKKYCDRRSRHPLGVSHCCDDI